MTISPFAHLRWTCLLALGLAFGLTNSTSAFQLSDEMVGQNEEAWSAWQAAAKSLERDERDAAQKSLEAVTAMNLSELRLALMADRTGSLRLEQWAKTDDAPAVVKDLMTKIEAGRRQKALAEDGWHFAAIGRFKYADANFKALDESNPDPVALLELARQNPNRHAILIKLLTNTDVGPSARRFLEILGHGEEQLRMDPHEIAANIEKLAGPTRMAFNAANRLKESGEYAIPHLIEALQDANRKSLHPFIIQVIPQIGRAGLNPLCIALGISDEVTKKVIIDSLARIAYRQAAPYLAKVADDSNASADIRSAARQAMSALSAGTANGAALFYELADNYYKNIDSLKADPRRDTANVWYLRDNKLRYVEVPTAPWNDIMAMRCCEEALLASPDLTQATALWIAANFQREAKLGLDVESDRADELAAKDSTRPENYPRAIYFARAAGPQYNHMVLARAYQDRDPGVALGAIAALSETAGEPSLVGMEDLKQPLVQTLSFPNRQVRIKAALALGRALPRTSFPGCENVIPVLAEALSQSQRQAALVVDPDSKTANAFQAVLRASGFDCAVGTDLNNAREHGRKQNISSYDLILISSDAQQPDVASAVQSLRADLLTAATPILIITKEGQMRQANSVARVNNGVEILLADVTELGDPAKITEQVMQRVTRASQALGMTGLSKDLSLQLALQATHVLRLIGESRTPVYNFLGSVPALLTALNSPTESLRVQSAHALALAKSAEAQTALCESALNAERGQEERVAFFGSLAESGRHNGNLLGKNELVQRLIDFTKSESNLILRAAASKALGALDLPSNQASEIIRGQYNG